MRLMFYLSYIGAELRRRSGRTVLTALGLAVGVGLVVTVTALSNGLDEAQDEVLAPLTGVGTDLSVSRPLRRSGAEGDFGAGGGSDQGLSDAEQQRLRRENGAQAFSLDNLGEPGERFETDDFITTQLSFPEGEVEKIERLDGIQAVSAGLTLNAIHLEGEVPEEGGQGDQAMPAPGGAVPGGAAPDSIDFDNRTVAGVDLDRPGIALVTPSEISKGEYFSEGEGSSREVVLSTAYAQRQGIQVGERISLKDRRFTVVGISQPPLGGQSSDIYMELGRLQELADRPGRVNLLQVRAASADGVGALAERIENTLSGAQVTTAEELADRVSGSLVDAKNLSGTLGTALAVVGLAAAFLTAGFLTLSSVTKRVRELGTLKALGWRQSLVVRQISGESLAQGLLGGALGLLLGLGGAALIDAFGPTLEATVASTTGGAGGAGGAGPGLGGPAGFGQGQVASGSTDITLGAPVDPTVILLALGLAVVGGLFAGALGGLRAARLRPAEALRHVG
jgi:ABC-type antimicrobial peptide transport system permease subunit